MAASAALDASCGIGQQQQEGPGGAFFRSLSQYRALVLDSSYRPVDVVNWQRAICMDLLSKAGGGAWRSRLREESSLRDGREGRWQPQKGGWQCGSRTTRGAGAGFAASGRPAHDQCEPTPSGSLNV